MTIYSTIWSDDDGYNRCVTVLDWRILGWVGVTQRMRQAEAGDVIIINGAPGFEERWRDMLSACALRLLRHRTKLVVSDVTWEPRSTRAESRAGPLWTLTKQLERAMVRRLADDRTVFCFLSSREVEHFRTDLAGGAGRAVFTPFFVTAPGERVEKAESAPKSRQIPPYIFSGGDTLRDWDLLTDALADCGVDVHVATRHVDRIWPANFKVGPLSNEEFFERAGGATAGVLALRSDLIRSAGQQTYLNLLCLGVPVVVNAASGVGDHLDGVAGAFITGAADAGEMRDRTLWLCDEANRAAIDVMTAEGRKQVNDRFSAEAYLMRLVDIARAM